MTWISGASLPRMGVKSLKPDMLRLCACDEHKSELLSREEAIVELSQGLNKSRLCPFSRRIGVGDCRENSGAVRLSQGLPRGGLLKVNSAGLTCIRSGVLSPSLFKLLPEADIIQVPRNSELRAKAR